MILLCALLGIVAGLWYYLSSQKRPKGKPIPGPKGWPLVGNGLEMTPDNFHVKLSEYTDTYGDIVKVKVYGDTIVSLGTSDLIRTAFHNDPYKKYLNDRSAQYWAENILINSESIAFYPNAFDGMHGAMRKGFTKGIHVYGDGIKDFEGLILIELRRLQKKIDEDRDGFEFVGFIKRSLTNVIAYLLNGEALEDDDDDVDLFWQLDHVDEEMLNATNNTLLLNFPFLVKVPGYYKQLYEDGIDAKARVMRRYFYNMRDTYTPGVVRGLVDFLLAEQIRETEAGGVVTFSDNRIVNTILETIAAGIVTTLAGISNMMLFMLHHPEYQARIQKELDGVMGEDPAVEDRKKCPFLEATMLESTRYIPVIPLSVSHLCSTDLEFEGYHIPAGSTVIPNIWHVHHDKAVWGDPYTFRPDRWLDESGQLLPITHPLRRNWLTFGTGRRQCIGEQFARNRMFLYFASLLKAYKFTAIPGKCGSYDPREKDTYDVSLIMRAKPFYCKAERRY